MKKHLTLILFMLSINSYSQLILNGSLNSVVEQRKRAIFVIEIWERPVDPLTGRRPITLAKDNIVESFSGFSIGKGYILTAAHPFKEFLSKMKEKLPNLYMKVLDYKNRPVLVNKIGKCGKELKGATPDICILKGKPYNTSFFELPKELNLDPSQSVEMGIINKSSHISKNNALLTGKFKKSLTYKEGFNSGIKIWKTTIDTAAGNSGSPVFDLSTGKILGMTTVSVIIKGEAKAEVIPIQYIRKYLNHKDWKTKKIPMGMRDYLATIYTKKGK